MLTSTTRSGKRALHVFGALLFALLATAALLPASPASASASAPAADPAVGVATRPATADGHPDGRTRLTYAADPGQTVTDQVLVGNTGTAREEFTVYATDAHNGKDGSFALLATADKPSDVGAWVTFENGADRIQFSLDPDKVKLVTFTVHLPANASPGDHVGGLVASVLEKGQQVSLDRRVATAIFARVSGDLQPHLTVASVDAVHQGAWWNPLTGTVKVLYTVRNAGNVALAANVSGTVATWFGIPATGARGAGVPVLLPGNSATYELDLPAVAQWGYLNPGVRLQPFVDSADDKLQLSVAPTSRDTVVFAMPWTILILLALAAGVYFLLRWRRKRDAVRAQEWMDYVEQSAAAEREPELAGTGKANDS